MLNITLLLLYMRGAAEMQTINHTPNVHITYIYIFKKQARACNCENPFRVGYGRADGLRGAVVVARLPSECEKK